MSFEFSGRVVVPSEEFFEFLQKNTEIHEKDVGFSLAGSFIDRNEGVWVFVDKQQKPCLELEMVFFWDFVRQYHPEFPGESLYGVPYLLSGDVVIDMAASTESLDSLVSQIERPVKQQWNGYSTVKGRQIFTIQNR